MKKAIEFFLIVFALSYFVAFADEGKSYYAEYYKTSVEIEPDGSLFISEDFAFRFVEGEFSFAYREIPARYTEGIEFLTGSIDNQQYDINKRRSPVYIVHRPDEKLVVWKFSRCSDTLVHFNITYRVKGAIGQNPEYDYLKWYMLPEKHDYVIKKAELALKYPDNIICRHLTSDSREFFDWDQAGHTVRLTMSNLEKNKTAIITAEFDKGIFRDTPPPWQKFYDLRQAIQRLIRPGVVTIILAGLLYLLFELLKIRRSKSAFPPADIPVITPPGDDPPAIAAALAGRRINFNIDLIYASLLYLAKEGHIRIKPVAGYKEDPGPEDFMVYLISKDRKMMTHLQKTLKFIFQWGSGSRTEAKLLTLAERLAHSMGEKTQFYKALKRDLWQYEYYSEERIARKTRLARVGHVSLAMAGVSFIIDLCYIELVGSSFIQILGAFLGIAFILYFFSSQLSLFSDKAYESGKLWKKFAAHLAGLPTVTVDYQHNLDNYREYLPYATAFSLEKRWNTFFGKHGVVISPSYFQGYQTIRDTSQFSIGRYAGFRFRQPVGGGSSSFGGGGGGGGFSGGGDAGGGGSSGAG